MANGMWPQCPIALFWSRTRRAKIWSMQPRPFRKPACSCLRLTSKAQSILLRRTLQKTLLGMDRSIMPLQLSQFRGGSRIFLRRGCTSKEWRHWQWAKKILKVNTYIRNFISGGVRTPCTLPLDPPLQLLRSPFFGILDIRPLLQSLGMVSWFQISAKRSVNTLEAVMTSALNNSACSGSIPGALPLIALIAVSNNQDKSAFCPSVFYLFADSEHSEHWLARSTCWPACWSHLEIFTVWLREAWL